MRTSKTRLIVLAILPFLLHAGTLPNAAGSKRDYARCSLTCKVMLTACDDRIALDCLKLFGHSDSEYAACLLSGTTLCLSFGAECQQICQPSKDASKEEP